jgi:MFS family permease
MLCWRHSPYYNFTSPNHIGFLDNLSVTTSPTLLRIVLTVFLPFASGYYMSYFFRSVNAIIAPDLKAEFDLVGGGLGLMTAAYLITFAAFQIPLGLLLDRFGPVKVQAVLLATAALGAFVFASGDSILTLFIGRALIGLGVSGGLMSSFKAIVLWFPRERLPLVNGLFMSFGGLGALSATGPVEIALGFTDWRGVYAGVGVATAVVAATIFLLTPEKAESKATEGLASQFKGLLEVYRDRLFWRIAPVACTGAAAGLSIQTLWIGPWLSDVAGMDRSDIAGYLTLVAGSMAVGMAAMGIIADFVYRKFDIAPKTVIVAGTGLFVLVQLAVIFEVIALALPLWMLFGFLSNFAALGFAVLSQHFPTNRSAVSNAGLNLLVFGMAFALQSGIGAVIDLFPTESGAGFHPQGFQAAFAIVVVLEILGIVWYLIAPKVIGHPSQPSDQ